MDHATLNPTHTDHFTQLSLHPFYIRESWVLLSSVFFNVCITGAHVLRSILWSEPTISMTSQYKYTKQAYFWTAVDSDILHLWLIILLHRPPWWTLRVITSGLNKFDNYFIESSWNISTQMCYSRLLTV